MQLDFSSFRVRNETVWRRIRFMFMGAAAIFLINNFFGFDNALTEGDLPRGQLLIHLHAGTIGWITLSVITMAVWIFSGDRELSETYVSRVKTLSWLIIVIFGGYPIAFGLAFSIDGLFFLMPIFGIPAALIIWTMAAFAITQFRRSETKTAPELFVTTALAAVSVGALMGILLGLGYALETNLIPGDDAVGSHAGVMDGYLLVAASTFVSWFLERGGGRYSRGALAQAMIFFVGTIIAWIGFLSGLVDQLVGLAGLLVLIGVIVYTVRNIRGLLQLNPLRSGPHGWTFFGGIWAIIWGLIFVYLIQIAIVQGTPFEEISPWLFTLFAHAVFVGTMTNLILGACSVRSHAASDVLSWAEPTSRWLINLGIIVFVGLKAANDSRAGAFVMGIGVVLGVLTMILRLYQSEEKEMQPAAAAGD